jgi:hypothetical protein
LLGLTLFPDSIFQKECKNTKSKEAINKLMVKWWFGGLVIWWFGDLDLWIYGYMDIWI